MNLILSPKLKKYTFLKQFQNNYCTHLSKSNTKKVVLIGLGPHSQRIYINSLSKMNITPTLIVDLDLKKEKVERYLKEKKMNSNTFYISSAEKDREELTNDLKEKLDFQLKNLNITHAIIATEPKSHFAYLKYFISRKIDVLIDKPIVSPTNVCNEEAQCWKIKQQYEELLKMQEIYKTRVSVNCQRRYDQRFHFIKSILKENILKYQVPLNYISIYHSDGVFYMPDDSPNLENHPYKVKIYT